MYRHVFLNYHLDLRARTKLFLESESWVKSIGNIITEILVRKPIGTSHFYCNLSVEE